MNTSATALSAELEPAVVHTLGLLELVSDAFRQPRPTDVDEYLHLRFEGLVLLASHRGRHPVDIDHHLAADPDRPGDLDAHPRSRRGRGRRGDPACLATVGWPPRGRGVLGPWGVFVVGEIRAGVDRGLERGGEVLARRVSPGLSQRGFA